MEKRLPLMTPTAALLSVLEALGFELQDTPGLSSKQLVHKETGRVLIVNWVATSVLDDLKHFHGQDTAKDAEQLLCRMILDELWGAVTQGETPMEKQARTLLEGVNRTP